MACDEYCTGFGCALPVFEVQAEPHAAHERFGAAPTIGGSLPDLLERERRALQITMSLAGERPLKQGPLGEWPERVVNDDALKCPHGKSGVPLPEKGLTVEEQLFDTDRLVGRNDRGGNVPSWCLRLLGRRAARARSSRHRSSRGGRKATAEESQR